MENLREQSCCFTGHRLIAGSYLPTLRQQLLQTVTELAEYRGVTRFYVGGALGFDTLAAQTVLQYQNNNPAVSLILVQPCRDQAERWSPSDIQTYQAIQRACSQVICLSEVYRPDCMLQRNRYMVDQSQYCVCYQTRSRGGTAYTVRYARQKRLTVISLAKEEPSNQISF